MTTANDDRFRVVRKASYQGVPQWGIASGAEITPSKATARKWSDMARNEQREADRRAGR